VLREVNSQELRRSVFHNGCAASVPLPIEYAQELEETARDLDPVNAHSLFELNLYLANMLLKDTDQMSMAHGLEVRDPLLDHRLVEAVAGIPGMLKLQGGRLTPTKSLLVDALPCRLPEHVFCRPKMGFVFPWEHWLRNELRDRVENTLLDPEALE